MANNVAQPNSKYPYLDPLAPQKSNPFFVGKTGGQVLGFQSGPRYQASATTATSSRTSPTSASRTSTAESSGLSELIQKVRAVVSWRWLVWIPLSIGAGVYLGAGVIPYALILAACVEVIIHASVNMWTLCRNSERRLTQMIEAGNVDGANQFLDAWETQLHAPDDLHGHKALRAAYQLARSDKNALPRLKGDKPTPYTLLAERMLRLKPAAFIKGDGHENTLKLDFMNAVEKGQAELVTAYLTTQTLNADFVNDQFLGALNSEIQTVAIAIVNCQPELISEANIESRLNNLENSHELVMTLINKCLSLSTHRCFLIDHSYVFPIHVQALLSDNHSNDRERKNGPLSIIEAMLKQIPLQKELTHETALKIWLFGHIFREKNSDPTIADEIADLFNSWIHQLGLYGQLVAAIKADSTKADSPLLTSFRGNDRITVERFEHLAAPRNSTAPHSKS